MFFNKMIIRWILNNVENKQKLVCIPIWKISRNGSDLSVKWINYNENPRFAIYSPNNNNQPADDLVLDKETGLIWPRNANIIGQYNWLDANTLCHEFNLGNRIGWRLPRVEELSSLIDRSQSNPSLPAHHPFINVHLIMNIIL